MGSQFLSDILGWASIACWLFAQFPQVLENIRRQSCEGLALPFLCNWLLGDITNLTGCLLTHQLPFQTWLATYFCSVDFMLFSQYFYYGVFRKRLNPSPSLLESGQVGTHNRKLHEQANYRALSNAAAHLAVAAARAAEEEGAPPLIRRSMYEQTHKRGSSSTVHRVRRHSTDEPLVISTAQKTKSPARNVDGYSDEEEDEVDEDALAALADSFHSESGRAAGKMRYSYSQERAGAAVRNSSRPRTRVAPLSPIIPHAPSVVLATQSDLIDPTSTTSMRGRSLQRHSPDAEEELLLENGVSRHSRTTSLPKERRSSRASARLVFLGVWALFGVGTLGVSRTAIAQTEHNSITGTVLSRTEENIPTAFAQPPSTSIVASTSELRPVSYLADDVPPIYGFFSGDPSEPPSSERVVGRISAWICTTLYLTSRLPQIWKNFARKSVEGLSMALFIFAFLGNFFYVFSILTSPNMDLPKAQARAYLKESVPYLLGSGGTLMFDITIVVQSYLYRPKPHSAYYNHQHRHRSSTLSHSRSRSHSHSHTHPPLAASAASRSNANTNANKSRFGLFGRENINKKNVQVVIATAGNTSNVRRRSKSRSGVAGDERENEPLLPVSPLSPRISMDAATMAIGGEDGWHVGDASTSTERRRRDASASTAAS